MLNDCCCFLKQINFRNVYVKTADLEKVFLTIPIIKNVKIVLTTGNIVFTSNKNIIDIYDCIKQTLQEYFNYSFDVFIKSMYEIKTIITDNPFKEKNDFVIQTFISNNNDYIADDILKEFNNNMYIKTKEEQMRIINKQLYWQYSRDIKAYG